MKRITILVILISLFTLLAGCNSDKEEKQKYIEQVKSINEKILSSSTVSEKVINSYSKIWLEAIENGITLEKFAELLDTTNTNVNTIYSAHHMGVGLLEDNEYSKVEDFNEAITIAETHYKKTGDIETINSARASIQSSIKEIALPPEEYQSIYNELFELYKNYEKYVDLAIDPSGSLQSYTSKAQSLSPEIVSGVKAVSARLPQ